MHGAGDRQEPWRWEWPAVLGYLHGCGFLSMMAWGPHHSKSILQEQDRFSVIRQERTAQISMYQEHQAHTKRVDSIRAFRKGFRAPVPFRRNEQKQYIDCVFSDRVSDRRLPQSQGKNRGLGVVPSRQMVYQLLSQCDLFSRTNSYLMTPASQRRRTSSFLVQVWVKVWKDQGRSKAKILQLDALNGYFHSNVSKMINLHSHTHIHTKETPER